MLPADFGLGLRLAVKGEVVAEVEFLEQPRVVLFDPLNRLLFDHVLPRSSRRETKWY